jgi:phosphoribosyl-AMP cyclohydrolase
VGHLYPGLKAWAILLALFRAQEEPLPATRKWPNSRPHLPGAATLRAAFFCVATHTANGRLLAIRGAKPRSTCSRASAGLVLLDPIMNPDFRFTKDGLIPAIVRDANPPGRVLMMAWMNRDSIERTLATGLMHYWSRTRQELWLKGETSGHTQKIVRWFTDCDRDTLLFEVEQTAGACHTGHFSCFFQELDWEGNVKPVVESKVFDPVEAYPK